MPFDLNQSIHHYPLVAFDTETSGPYPIESEIVELGAVKWYKGKIVDRFQTLLKPSRAMLPDNIVIHGITNEMVADAPQMKDEIAKFCKFIDGSVLMAHHAPFDLGFLTIEIEKAELAFPQSLQVCTSLISRALLTTTNHKLQTLVKELGLTGGAAHRAYDDAYACLQVFFKSCEKLGEDVNLNRVLELQKKEINWNKYRIWSSQDEKIISLAKATLEQRTINIVYEGGQTKGKPRPIKPMGFVRNPDGDYLHAQCGLDQQRKRFYLDKILDFDR
ncbi:MAG: exonuclease [Bdellovibrio sp.]|nr:exonuclease [Bdellovibrio sp.]